jgi:hypothetical protein
MLETRKWKFEIRNWKIETRKWKLENRKPPAECAKPTIQFNEADGSEKQTAPGHLGDPSAVQESCLGRSLPGLR